MTDKVLVATYGSLRKNMENFHVNSRANATSIGEGWTEEPAVLSRYGGAYFPMVSLHSEDAVLPVRVEVFETTQAGLEGPYDGLEGYPHFYDRTQIPVVLDSGEKVTAWIYHIEDRDSRGEVVPSGDWKIFKGVI